jgi:hypothetical protein
LPRFVIQKHAARSLHYDFRLEAGGALKSWIEEGIEQGHATFWLEADARRNPVSTHPESVLSGRTIEEVREREG